MIYPDNFESKIGFDRIKSQIKALCVTQGAADKLSEAEFSNDYDTVVRRLEQTYEMRTALMLESGFPDGSFVDTEPFLKKAAVIGAFLDVEEIVALRKDSRRSTRSSPFSAAGKTKSTPGSGNCAGT